MDPELEIWFCNGNKLQSTAFIERLIQTLLSNPYPYYDQIQTLMERGKLIMCDNSYLLVIFMYRTNQSSIQILPLQALLPSIY